MGNNQTRVNAQDGSAKFDITHHETDSPLLPVAQIERLHSFAPDRVQWVFDQTEKESEFRRNHTLMVSKMVFVERILGKLIAAGVCCIALYAAYFTALAGHDAPAVAIGSTAVVGLAVAFLNNRTK